MGGKKKITFLATENSHIPNFLFLISDFSVEHKLKTKLNSDCLPTKITICRFSSNTPCQKSQEKTQYNVKNRITDKISI